MRNMKIRIKTYNDELPSYLTVGNVYEVVEADYLGFTDLFSIYDDEDVIRIVNKDNCDYLNGGEWEVVSE